MMSEERYCLRLRQFINSRRVDACFAGWSGTACQQNSARIDQMRQQADGIRSTFQIVDDNQVSVALELAAHSKRLLMYLLAANNLRLTTLFPRDRARLAP